MHEDEDQPQTLMQNKIEKVHEDRPPTHWDIRAQVSLFI
jgi:hypothetical protein